MHALRPIIDEVLGLAGINLDFTREKSAYLSLAGLLDAPLDPSSRVAVVISGSRSFRTFLDPPARFQKAI
ncbi:hypothetical protein C8D89_109101 [Actinomycetospora cinnamomea]|uniref:Uncharacterized protein n=1 Tax=Actinomycetospora cinnamomea TaxID=663609 RepID=A0A2U1F7R8_9PSEU|nr:hypothetical protein C8D89_109101 [Actinomycetospora cinnamomea]